MKKTIMFPGQGAQYKGMGKNLFPQYPQLTKTASNILGYSIEELCLNDAENKLGQTQYTQPALYVVNALSYEEHKKTNQEPISFFIGHSLGEYNALLAAQVFDFETGLKLVQKRGELMSKAHGGGMLAVLKTSVEDIKNLLKEHNLQEIDIANYNTPTQTILSGPKESITHAESVFFERQITCMPLNVSAAFHSRYMKDAQAEFESFLKIFSFSSLKTPVISNVTARPYVEAEISSLLAKQISNSVLWSETIFYLINQGEMTFTQMGDNPILSRMVIEIQKTLNP